MSSITKMKGTIVLLFGLILVIMSGCSKQNSDSTINPDTGKHVTADWRNAHQTTDESLATDCAGCHTNGANSPILAPTPPAPAGTAPGCFNNTLCHGAGHPAGWAAADQHGASAKAQATGFSRCQSCHGTLFDGGTANISCYTCHVSAPHPPTPWITSATPTLTHTTTNEGNAAVCAGCHTGGDNLTSIPTPTPAPPAGTPAGCFNNTLCHAQLGHAVGWNSADVHGAAAKLAPSGAAMQGFSKCQECHGVNFAGGTATTCLNTVGCHGAGVDAPHAFPWQSTSTRKHSTTAEANATACGLCHLANRQPPSYVPLAQVVGCFDNTLCHAAAATSCVVCHASAQGTRDAVVGEFGLAWGHKKSGRSAVTDADCIVCHLEGDFASQARSATYHADGNIDLRDPDGAGETPITNISGGAFTFTKFSTSYAAGSRTPTGHTSNNIDNVLTQKFCLACHDSNGATNPTVRSGTAPTQYLPFGTGSQNGAAYTVGLSAGVVGGVVDVDRQFATTNASVHPVKGPRNKAYPTTARLNAPYNNFTRTPPTKSDGVVINCFDCHNTPTTPLTTRTVAAHGNAVTLRGNTHTTNASPYTQTLCNVCHFNYIQTGTTNHTTGSAFGTGGNSSMNTRIPSNCQYCHGSGETQAQVVRPVRGEDVHGFDRFAGTGTDAMWPRGATETYKTYAFIRNTNQWNTTSWKPLSGTGVPAGTATCGGTMSSGQCSDNMTTYTPGGTY
jgi:hypothetical protein